MSKAVTELSARIRRIEAAEPRAKALPRGTMLSSKPMCELLGISWVTLRGYCDDIEGFEQSGSFVRGGNGIEWEFKPKATVAYLLKHFRGVATKQAAKSRKLTKAVGVSLSDDDEAVSLVEVKDRVNLTLTLVAATEKQGLYVLASDAADFLAGYNQRVIDGIMGVKTKVDPNGNLPPAVRKQVDEYLRSVATEVNEAANKAIEGYRARTQQEGTGGASRASIRA